MGGGLVVTANRAAELLTDLRERGLKLRAEGERLLVAPKAALTPEIREALVTHKREILPLLQAQDPEVQWRLEAMRLQITPTGSIRLLVARDIQPAPGTCLSCGDPLVQEPLYRCHPCLEAATLALQESREVLLGRPRDEDPR
jgi:hypothetical protein